MATSALSAAFCFFNSFAFAWSAKCINVHQSYHDEISQRKAFWKNPKRVGVRAIRQVTADLQTQIPGAQKETESKVVEIQRKEHKSFSKWFSPEVCGNFLLKFCG